MANGTIIRFFDGHAHLSCQQAYPAAATTEALDTSN